MKAIHGYSILGIVTLLSAAGYSNPTVRKAVAAGQSVIVGNSTANPVPTAAQGTTMVAGSVGATQSGAWSVGVSGPVTVGNQSSNPVPVQVVVQANRTPFNYSAGMFLPDKSYSWADDFFTIPAGKHLIVQHLSVGGYLPGGQNMVLMQLKLVRANSTQYLSLPFSHQGQSVENQFGSGGYTEYFAYDSDITLRLESGEKFGLKMRRNSNQETGDSLFTLLGYLEDN